MITELVLVLRDWLSEDYATRDAAGLVDRINAWLQVARGEVHPDDRCCVLYSMPEQGLRVEPVKRLPYSVD